MSIILFAIIGATIKAGMWYWICYGVYVVERATVGFLRFLKGAKDEGI